MLEWNFSEIFFNKTKSCRVQSSHPSFLLEANHCCCFCCCCCCYGFCCTQTQWPFSSLDPTNLDEWWLGIFYPKFVRIGWEEFFRTVIDIKLFLKCYLISLKWHSNLVWGTYFHWRIIFITLFIKKTKHVKLHMFYKWVSVSWELPNDCY